jgi:hypothetical protein
VASLVVVRRYPEGPRCWLLGQRVHHGASGLLAAALLRRHPRLAAVALLAVAHDAHDWRVWFAREGVPAGEVLDSTAPVA